MPKCYEDIDDRGTIRLSLKTDSLTLARSKRDALAQADEQLWLTLSAGKGSVTSLLDPKTGKALKRYEAARHRAMSRGFVYAPANELASNVDLEDIVKRLLEVARHPEKEKTEARALLGGVTRPKIPVSKAFEIFCEKIAVSQVIGKSDAQKQAWKKAKKRAVTNFIKTCGDLPMKSRASMARNSMTGGAKGLCLMATASRLLRIRPIATSGI